MKALFSFLDKKFHSMPKFVQVITYVSIRMTGVAQYKLAYMAAVKSGLATHEQYKDNYRAYGHWVPQFGVLALTMNLD